MPRIQHKRGTSANLASVNPTPLAGELVWDSTENAIKIGDGATAWTSLAYVTATPRSHVHDGGDITSGTVAYARLPVGSTSSTVCAGDDSRLTDARAPTAHKASHATGGSDALTPADIGAAPAASPTFTGTVTVSAGSSTAALLERPLTASPSDGSNQGIQLLLGTAGASNSGAIFVHRSYSTGSSSTITRNAIRMYDTGIAIEAASFGDVVNFDTTTLTSTFSGVITVAATSGSAGSYAPSVCISGDPNTGFGQVSGQSDTASIFTAGHERVRVDSSGRVGIGVTPSSGNLIQYGRDISGGTGINGFIWASTIRSDVTSSANVFRTFVGTENVSFTLTTLSHFRASQNTFGASSTVATQVGFLCDAVSGGTNNYGFQGLLSSGTGRYNLYMSGTADNFINGDVGIKAAPPTAALDINSDKIRLRTAKTPASASDTGNAGDICWDANYLYICIASGTWRRVAHSTW